MGEATKIEWADHTWSPWRGCTKVSGGCKFCYAETLSKRNTAVLGEWGPNGKRVVNKDWNKPITWDRAAKKSGEQKRIFPSLCDPFEERDDLIEIRDRFWDVVSETPHLDWLILTKRPENLNRMVPWTAAHAGQYRDRFWENVWLGTSVENQATTDERIPRLLEIPAAVRWLSVEPLLGPIDLSNHLRPHCPGCCGPLSDHLVCTECEWCSDDGCCINWVVVGGESGPHARPCDLQWIRSIVKQCKDAGVPVFVKQLGSKPFDSSLRISIDGENSHARAWHCDHPKGGDPDEWPADLKVQEFPR